jgi:hypothetical protein
MITLVRKMKNFGILKLQLIVGAIIMIAAVIVLPVSIMINDISLILDPYVLCVVLIGMVIFGMFAYFLFIRPYRLYHKLPEVLVETDGEYLYIHGKKEAKILLSEIDECIVDISLPYFYSKELLAVLLVHLLSENYGDMTVEIFGHGDYKLRFVANVQETRDRLIAFIREEQRKSEQ